MDRPPTITLEVTENFIFDIYDQISKLDLSHSTVDKHGPHIKRLKNLI